ncbi:hypothetical protein AVEN_246525-1 [Araneus ventricosus]|uniref:Uncharacterized protein n=1 Tax=Araneus ventricosus TaxID=182803 RepID=A0A4Y2Q9Q9_ARAVE|nr:hypothetical protein AVEN_246525-1 [Araneus ventricosus]
MEQKEHLCRNKFRGLQRRLFRLITALQLFNTPIPMLKVAAVFLETCSDTFHHPHTDSLYHSPSTKTNAIIRLCHPSPNEFPPPTNTSSADYLGIGTFRLGRPIPHGLNRKVNRLHQSLNVSFPFRPLSEDCNRSILP